ncbi:MAG: hypothetical protein HS102_14960 [Planctomycetia bacterium]|nr:hypothetical protein [Planctomycetia bacterium]
MAGGGLLLTTAGALAANYTWTGHGSNDDWDTGSNWVVACCNPAYPDDSGDNATISGTHSVNLINESIGNLALSGTVIFNDADGNDPTLAVQKVTLTGATGGTTIKIKQKATLETD